jgi:plasmid stabilization system protein ParE
MAYKVSLTRPAETDAALAFERINEAAPDRAVTWLRGLFAAISTLAEMPERCPESADLGHPARHLLYGKQSGQYRIIFAIQEDSKEGPRVRVLRIWHGSRDALTLADREG